METEIGAMHVQTKEYNGFPVANRYTGRETMNACILSQNLQKEPTLQTHRF